MVGLPARGKTYIAQKLKRYLNWLNIPTSVFNVGNYRRKNCGAELSHHFFDPNNSNFSEMRRQSALEALQDMIAFLEGDGVVGIYDATNSTKSRRQMVFDELQKHGIRTLFIESLCDDQELIMSNIKEVKLSSPDYVHMDPEKAAEDFMLRIRHYEEAYETIDEDVPYVKLVNVGIKFVVNKITCYLQSRIVFYLVNLHIKPRSIYMCRVE